MTAIRTNCFQGSRLFFILLVFTCCTMQRASAQERFPFDTKWLRSGTYEMACYSVSGGSQTETSTFIVEINNNGGQLAIYTTLNLVGSEDQWLDTSIADATTFKPVYRASFNRNRELRLKFGKEVTGYHYDKKTKKRSVVKEPVSGFFLDSYSYPYLIGLLPLASGYSTSLPVYEFKSEQGKNITKTRVEEVKSGMYTSSLTGPHKVWAVDVIEEGTNDRYVYHVDKDSRRLWKIDVFTGDQHILMIDKETDFNPFTSTFDKAATLKMIKSGSAVISGQAFARDNENEGMLKGMAVLNINKKQYAQPGTSIVLIPYTDFFKEWIKLNESSRKKGRAIPLPQGATDCIKVASVYDDKGHFEFVNLMPGEYLIFTQFGYNHTSRRTEVVGYTDTYVNGLYQGTSANTVVNSYSTNAGASVKKVVLIEEHGERVEIKLKKTL